MTIGQIKAEEITTGQFCDFPVMGSWRRNEPVGEKFLEGEFVQLAVDARMEKQSR